MTAILADRVPPLLLTTLALTGALASGSAFAQDITNGNFETGDFSGWAVVDSPMPFVPMQVSGGLPNIGFGFFTHTVTEGDFGMVMGFETLTAPVTMTMTQDVTISADRPSLRFKYRAAWDMFNFANSTMDREGFVRIRDQAGTMVLLERRFLRAASQSVNTDTGDRNRTIDLSQFAGQTVQLAFEWELPEAGTGPGLFQVDDIRMQADDPGVNYCMAELNSTGVAAEFEARGSTSVADNDMVLIVSGLPNNSFGFYVTSPTQAFIVNPGGSAGNLCLGGNVGRFVGPGQIQQAGGAGRVDLVVDLTQHPTPNGLIAIAPGETWNFQYWYRDMVGGAAGSNFSDGYEIGFL